MTLDRFHPAVASWFETALGAPTPCQTQAWEAMRRQPPHILVTTPEVRRAWPFQYFCSEVRHGGASGRGQSQDPSIGGLRAGFHVPDAACRMPRGTVVVSPGALSIHALSIRACAID